MTNETDNEAGPFRAGGISRTERANPVQRTERHRLRPVTEMPADVEDNRLRIPRDQYPDQFDLQWVTTSIFGQPQANNVSRHTRRGWEPVHGDDFDGMYDGRFTPTGSTAPIEVDGMALMARPLSWSQKAKQEDLARARGAVAIKEAQINGGDALAETGMKLDPYHPTARRASGVKRTLVPMEGFPVPKNPVDES